MVRRQPFDDFLDSPGPSTPRGRGGARGGSGRGGGGRGGTPRSNGTPGSSHKFASDYSQVPFDYTKLNGKKYKSLEGFSVQPFGNTPPAQQTDSPTSTPRGRGSSFRGGGGRKANFGPHQIRSQSGSATPVTGLGYHGQGHSFNDKGKGVDRGGGPGKRYRIGETVGRTGVLWGGGKAPLFVKAGELFKDGEVDIITVDKDNHVHVDAESLSDPSAPQMNHLEDEVEVDILDKDLAAVLGKSHREPVPWSPASPQNNGSTEDRQDTSMEQDEEEVSKLTERDAPIAQMTIEFQESVTFSTAPPHKTAPVISDALPISSPAVLDARSKSDFPQPADRPLFFVDIQPTPSNLLWDALKTQSPQSKPNATEALAEVSQSPPSTEDDLFFVDTAPEPTVPSADQPQYESSVAVPLGHTPVKENESEDEKIIFRPRTFATPKPIAIDVPPSAQKIHVQPVEEPVQEIVQPHHITRREKKALKKEKRNRKRNKGKKNTQLRDKVHDGSDLEWGSDGPPVHLLSVEGMGDVAEDEEIGDRDMEILKDYLAGTLLGAETDEESDMEMDEEAVKAFGDGAREVGDGEEFELESGEEDNPWVDTSGSEGEEAEVEMEIAVEDESEDDEDEEEEHEGDSSDLGDLQFEAKDIDSDEDDEDDDDEDMFKGKDNWGDTEWLIAQMEEALDGDLDLADRKARNATFRAIESGDFGDNWGTVPAKKNKKGSHIPAELQGQWEKDRQRKAERRRQRDLERLLEAIDPYPATHGKKGKGKKAKGSSRIEQARMAHLIPESASRIAELFDIPSDVEDSIGFSRMGMGRMSNLLPGGRGLWTVDEGIKRFLEDSGKTTYSVPPMDKEGRKKVHMLAECYGLTSKSRGKGKNRFTVLTKTSRAGINVNEDKVARLVAAAPFSGGQFYKALYTKTKSKTSKKGPGDRGASARIRDGETVGEGAERIGMENIGHQLLSRMGWAEGSRIGKSDGGLDNPIIAIVKNTKMGLGA